MAGVNGVEIKVGQVWRTRGGALATVVSFDDHPDYPVNIKVRGDSASCGLNGRCWGDIGAEHTHDDDDDLIELVKDENGFTIWRGGEQPVSDDTMVTTRFNDGSGSTTRARSYSWLDTNLVAYKVVEQAAPQPTDSATLAEETLSALGWTFDGQAWVENAVVDLPIGMVPNALDVQVGGTHYKDCAIQPIAYIHANKLGFAEGNVVKYITRHRQKHGADDVRKVIHYCQLLLELEYGAGKTEGGV